MGGLIPKYLDQVNTVVRWFENPCDAPWLLYVELAAIPAGEAVLELLSFGLTDIVRSYARPKGLRSGRHGRRGRKSGRRRLSIPEPAEMVARRLPGAEQVHGRRVSQGVKALWLVDGVIQRGLWFWSVADITLGFFADWLTAVQQSEVCSIQRVGAAAFEDTGVYSALAGWQAVGGVTPLYQTGSVSLLGSPALWVGGMSWGGGAATPTFAARRVPSGGRPPGNRFETRIISGGEVIATEESTLDPTRPGVDSVVLSPRRITSAGNAQLQIRVVPQGFATVHTMGSAVQTIGDLT